MGGVIVFEFVSLDGSWRIRTAEEASTVEVGPSAPAERQWPATPDQRGGHSSLSRRVTPLTAAEE
jgi:hypothetical protein